MVKKHRKIAKTVLVMLLLITYPSYSFAGSGYDGISSLLITIVLVAFIFLIAREVVCWYWKMNQTVAILADIRDTLQYIKKYGIATTSDVLANDPLVESSNPAHCQHCGKDDAYMDAYNRLFCPNCGEYVKR